MQCFGWLITPLLVRGEVEAAYTEMSHATVEIIDLIYSKKTRSSLRHWMSLDKDKQKPPDYDPKQVISGELTQLANLRDVELRKLTLTFSKVPFIVSTKVTLIPVSIPALEELNRIEKWNIIETSALNRLHNILLIDLAKTLERQFSPQEQKNFDNNLAKTLEFTYVLNEFLFLRKFIIQQPEVYAEIQDYYDKLRESVFTKRE